MLKISVDYTWKYSSPLGAITLASDGEALTGLWFDGQKHFGSTLAEQHEQRRLPVFDDTCRWLDTYFSGRKPDITPRLSMRTTAFRRAVWEAMLAIPYGSTVSYAELAARVAQGWGRGTVSARAVGGAVGHNALLLVVPCHRVVGQGGALTGYAAGLDRKARLLEAEGASTSNG